MGASVLELATPRSCTSESLNSTLKDPTLLKLIGDYLQYQDKVRRGHLGKTGMFWLSMMDHARLVFMMDFAVKTNNFELFHHCNGAMADLFFAYDGHNYARYLTWFEAFLTNIDLSHPGALDYIKLGAIAVARSLIPGALAAVDKTMEETFMRFAKTSGGLLGLFNNCGAYQKWCRTTSARAQLYELTLEMCGMIDDPEMPKAGKHRELEPAQIKKSELAVQSVISAINGFTNPWRILDKSRLYSLASGAPIDPEVEADVLRAEAAGKAAKEQFIQERFISKRKDFFDRLKKLRLKTMDYCSKRVKLTSAQGKLFVYKEQSNLAFQLLVQTSEIYELRSNQEETDSRIVLYLHQAVKWGYKSSVVRTPDTDILMILLYHASRINLSIYLDHGSGKHRTLINVTELSESLGPDYCSTLLGFYVFTGEDCTSTFKGKGKVNPQKKLEKTPKLHKAFRQLGADWMVTDELQEEMESFTCIMYGQARMTSVDTVRRADKAIIESPKPHDPGMGWEKTGEEEVLEPVWAIGPILPPSLVEVLAQRAESEEHAALDKVTDYANNNLSVGEVDGELEME
ncbi:hypothetical protein F7725_018992 [Dissostichus mawsoni]|uniref:Uncharacterized protein n=1 Tax=Dissostichus mawsoni TaxID=36200 RepID=A0A7J5XT31_DISMA|nr:hypothetical protein F7725_018992 [Dissostichus mawsoni]